MNTHSTEGSTPTKLLNRQSSLVEEIFQHKSDINNIVLQLDRADDDVDKEWYAKAKYARSMKEAELTKLEDQLEGVKAAIQISLQALQEHSNDPTLPVEFMSAAKRRLNSEVYESIKEEAEELVQDALYDAAHCTHQA